MKNILILSILLLVLTKFSISQNVGIGTTLAYYPLTIYSPTGSTSVAQHGPTNFSFEFGVSTTGGGFIRSINGGGGTLSFSPSQSVTPALRITYLGSAGIGNANAQYPLDISGRVRLQHDDVLNQTAGMWLDGPVTATRAFIGMVNNDYFGLWGSGGAGWNFVQHVATGNTGIGTGTPTQRLDVNGGVRFRGLGIKKGSVLTSNDADGNAEWQEPVAFKAVGTVDGNIINMPANTCGMKMTFGLNTEYNTGLHYNAGLSKFVAPVDGLYQFNAQVYFLQKNNSGSITLMVRSEAGQYKENYYKRFYHGNPSSLDFESDDMVTGAGAHHISTTISLKQGDSVEVNLCRQTGADQISADAQRTWFSGYLIHRF
jgi:hypothetical protein